MPAQQVGAVIVPAQHAGVVIMPPHLHDVGRVHVADEGVGLLLLPPDLELLEAHLRAAGAELSQALGAEC